MNSGGFAWICKRIVWSDEFVRKCCGLCSQQGTCGYIVICPLLDFIGWGSLWDLQPIVINEVFFLKRFTNRHCWTELSVAVSRVFLFGKQKRLFTVLKWFGNVESEIRISSRSRTSLNRKCEGVKFQHKTGSFSLFFGYLNWTWFEVHSRLKHCAWSSSNGSTAIGDSWI